MALLEADVALPVIKEFIASVKEKAVGEEVIGSLSPGQALVGVVHRELTALMGETHSGLNLATQPPAVVLMAGLQGAGKTTTVGKLGKLLRESQKKKVLVVSCDVYRPAAIEQLKTVAGQAGIDFFPSEAHEKPVDIARRAVEWARRHYHDVVLVDTAGRLSIDEAMMRDRRVACRDQTDRNPVRRRCDARSGCDQHGQGIQRGFAAHRGCPDQA